MTSVQSVVSAALGTVVLLTANLAAAQSAPTATTAVQRPPVAVVAPVQPAAVQAIRPAAPPLLPTVPAPPPVVAPVRPRTAPAGTVAPRGPQAGDDVDGDGVAVPDDCDDRDASRFPGNSEVANDRDEDCNSATFGTLDDDRDGYTSWQVSNNASYGRNGPAGTDCDDHQAGIRPDAQELPNRIDDNCDGLVDNLLGTWWTPQ